LLFVITTIVISSLILSLVSLLFLFLYYYQINTTYVFPPLQLMSAGVKSPFAGVVASLVLDEHLRLLPVARPDDKVLHFTKCLLVIMHVGSQSAAPASKAGAASAAGDKPKEYPQWYKDMEDLKPGMPAKVVYTLFVYF
jgi:hypothetical protein